jgi:hypothetical protein
MALMMGSLYEALKEAGTGDDKAKAAAEEVAGYERDIMEMKSVQRLHTWMLGVNTAMILAILLRVFWS